MALIDAGAGNDPGAIRSVRISMTVSVDDLLQTLATAAALLQNNLRRATKYALRCTLI
ncbi:MAG: hypothetical protein ACYTFK_01895 [Planctomycetota bacterium]